MRPTRVFTLVAALAGAALLAIPSSSPAQGGLSGFAVSPALIRAQVVANRTGTLRLQVDNFEQAQMNLTLRFRSMQPENGTYRSILDAKHANDATSWFLKAEQQISIAPNGRANIQMQFRAPSAKPGSYWCFAELVPRVGNGQRSTFVYQVPIYFYLGRQPRPELKVSTPNLVVNGRQAAVAIPIANEGDGLVTVGNRVDIRDSQTGRVLQRLEDVERDLYPRTTRNVMVEARFIPDGTYTVIATTRIGTKNLQPMQQSFSVRNGRVSRLNPNSTFGLASMTFNPPALLRVEPAGSRRTYAISVTNGTDKSTTINLSAGTMTQLPNGSYQVLDIKPTGLSVTLTPPSLEVPSKASRTFKVVVEIPAGTRGDRWFGIVAKPAGGSTMAEQIFGRITVPNTSDPKMTMRSLGVEKFNGLPQALTVEITNKGNTALMPLPSAVILKDGVRPVADIEVPKLGDGGVLPGSVLQNRMPLPMNLPPGNYLISVSYQYGENLTERLTVPLTVAAKKASKPAAKKPAGKASSKPKGGAKG